MTSAGLDSAASPRLFVVSILGLGLVLLVTAGTFVAGYELVGIGGLLVVSILSLAYGALTRPEELF